MLNLDHYAIRCKNRKAAAEFYCIFLNYQIDEDFTLFFDEARTLTAECYALSHKTDKTQPRIFISEGNTGSIVDDWVNEKGGHGAIHHVAHVCDDVAVTMRDWINRGIKFTSNEPFETDGLIQAFTEVNPYTGIIYELINQDVKGFRAENVKKLMESTKNMGRGAP